jgi:hypothetical protein
MQKKQISLTSFFLFILFFALFFPACDWNREKTLVTTRTYFPTAQGKYRIYRVIDTAFEAIGPVRDEYYRKEENGEINPSLDILGRNVNALYVYRSEILPNNQYDFQVNRVWAMFNEPDEDAFVELIKENRRYLILRNPIIVDSTYAWNSTQFISVNSEDKEKFMYFNTDTTVTINGKTYSNCVMVLENNKELVASDKFKYRSAYSIYAPNIGRIYHYYKQVVYIDPDTKEIATDKSRISIEMLIENN